DARRAVGGVEPVELPRGPRLAAQVHQLGHGGLHAVGGLVVGDGGLDLVAAADRLLVQAVEALLGGEPAPLAGGGWAPAGGCGAGGGGGGGGVGGGEEAVVEVVQPAGGDRPAVEDEEGGQVAVLAAQAVADPGAHAGPPLQDRAGVQEVVGARVFGRGGD